MLKIAGITHVRHRQDLSWQDLSHRLILSLLREGDNERPRYGLTKWDNSEVILTIDPQEKIAEWPRQVSFTWNRAERIHSIPSFEIYTVGGRRGRLPPAFFISALEERMRQSSEVQSLIFNFREENRRIRHVTAQLRLPDTLEVIRIQLAHGPGSDSDLNFLFHTPFENVEVSRRFQGRGDDAGPGEIMGNDENCEFECFSTSWISAKADLGSGLENLIRDNQYPIAIMRKAPIAKSEPFEIPFNLEESLATVPLPLKKFWGKVTKLQES